MTVAYPNPAASALDKMRWALRKEQSPLMETFEINLTRGILKSMRGLSVSFILGLLLALIVHPSLHAQTAANTPAAASGAGGISVNASPPQQPSFDCRKAASLSEKTICGNAELSRLDSQLNRAWKTLLDGFMDDVQKTRIRQDQRTWIAGREKCGDGADCISKLYRDRLSTLNGEDSAHRFSGVYEVKDTGSFAVYPIGNRYLVSIQTADPSEGKWTCELNGEAESSGDDLKISVDGSVFQAHLQDTKTLVVGDTESVSKAASQFCGLNGTFAFSYLRVRPQP